MKTILVKNGNEQVFLYMDKSGGQVFPDIPSSLVDEVKEVDYPVINARIVNGEVVEVLPEEKPVDPKEKLKALFAGIRNLWQNLADDFAVENVMLGITKEGKTKEVADSFSQVVYYLNVNAPKEALAAIDLIPRDGKYLTDARLLPLKAKLAEFINANS